MLQSWKRLRIFFKNLGFHAFRGSGWRLVRWWKVQSREVHRDFHNSDRDSLESGTSSREKHLENFPKVFLSSVLAVGPGDFLVTWFSRENHAFCKNNAIFKYFEFPSNFCDFSLSSLPKTLSNSPCHSRTNFYFYIISTQILQEKCMSFLFFSTYFMFWVWLTWICELLSWFGIFVVSMMGLMNVCCVWIFWVLLIRFLGLYFFCFHGWYWLSVSIDSGNIGFIIILISL